MYKVLLVDDEAWILEGLKAMIDWEGEGFCICATASNGLEAESLVREQQPDFILADIRMPGCDGLALLGRLRQAGCNALYAIISGYAEFSYAQECIKLGACGYLLKPVEEEELLSLLRCVRQTLGQRYEKRIMEELEQETGLVETLFPRQCYLAVVYGGERFTPAIPALCARLSRRSRLYLSEQPLFSGEADVPEGACVIDRETWERKSYWEQFTQQARCYASTGKRALQRYGPAGTRISKPFPRTAGRISRGERKRGDTICQTCRPIRLMFPRCRGSHTPRWTSISPPTRFTLRRSSPGDAGAATAAGRCCRCPWRFTMRSRTVFTSPAFSVRWSSWQGS